MTKKKTMYVCQSCGYETPKWVGKCPGCKAWNTLLEEVVADNKTKGISLGLSDKSLPIPIADVLVEDLPRILTGSKEFDRVLGGGIIKGSLVLIAGDPGIGKSSLTLRVCANIAGLNKRVLYVTGEESTAQIRLRADRLGTLAKELFVVSETNLDVITEHITKFKPQLLVIDSIQTIFRPDLDSAPGSVSQVRESTVEILRLAKSMQMATFLIGHVTKEGSLAGPRVLEHIVDTVLFFEGEKNGQYRILRAVKNRFGSTNELGLFEMQDAGLMDVPDSAKFFLPDENFGAGSVIIPTVEGTRPLLLEVQALVAKTPYIPPRRTSDSIDIKKVQLLLAVLEKRVHLSLGASDVYVKVAGGIKIDEPAIDLGLALALASSFLNCPLKKGMVIVGEVGLSGEVRGVNRLDIRIKEAFRLGFTKIILPLKNSTHLGEVKCEMDIYPVRTLHEALGIALENK